MPNRSSEVEPRVAVGDVGGALAEDANLAGIRHRGAGDEVDEQLACAGVDAAERHPFAGCDGEPGDAQRTKTAVVLADAARSPGPGAPVIAVSLTRASRRCEFRPGKRGSRRAGRRDEHRRRESPIRRILRDPADRPACCSGAAAPASGRCARPRCASSPCTCQRLDERVARRAFRGVPGTRFHRPHGWCRSRPPPTTPRRGTKRRSATAEQPGERVGPIDCLARSHERVGDGRPADAARAGFRRRDQRVHVDRHTEAPQPRAHVPNTTGADRRAALSGTRRASLVGIDEIAEHVDVVVVFDRGDLDTGERRARRSVRPTSTASASRRPCRDR